MKMMRTIVFFFVLTAVWLLGSAGPHARESVTNVQEPSGETAAEGLLSEANRLFEERRYDEAQALAKQVLAFDPKNGRARELLEKAKNAAEAEEQSDTFRGARGVEGQPYDAVQPQARSGSGH